MILEAYGFTNKGGRDNNEDSIEFVSEGDNGLFIVADGLGGHEYGERASEKVCETIAAEWENRTEGDVQEWMLAAITKAQESILEMQEEQGAKMKSTVVALVVENGIATWANSGDSRLYFFHDNEIESVTDDHSVAFKKYKSGEITRDAIRYDEDQPCLLKVLGNADRFEPDIVQWDRPLEVGDAFFLCSDGAWEYFSDGETLVDLLKSESAEEWAELVLLRIMDRISEGNDNLSVITVIVKE